MAQKKYIEKAQIISQIQEKIKQAEAYQNQVPYALAEQRVRKIVANPCLQGKFYLNALYKETQTEQSEEEAIKYKVKQTEEYTYEKIMSDSTIPAYVAVYKVKTIKKSDEDLANKAAEKIGKVNQQSRQQKNYIKGETLKQADQALNDYTSSIETKTQTFPLVFLGPYKNYNEAEAQFKKSKYYDTKTKELFEKKKQLKVIGMLPAIHNINYLTTQKVIYYIFLEFNDKIKKIADQHLKQYINKNDGEEYVLHSSGVEGITGTNTNKLLDEFDKSECLVKEESVHKTLRNNRHIYLWESLYDITTHVSQQSDNELLPQEKQVQSYFKDLLKFSQTTENMLKDIKTDLDNNQKGLANLKIKTLIQYIGGSQSDKISSSYNKAIAIGDTETLNKINSSALNKLIVKYNPNHLADMATLLKEIKTLKIQISSLKKQYAAKPTDDLKKQLQEKQASYNFKLQTYNDMKSNGNNITYEQLDAAVKECVQDRKEYFDTLKKKAEDAKSSQKVYLEDYVAKDNKITFYCQIRPKSVPVSFNFKTLKSNNFKPELDKELTKIKQEYGVKKIYKTDPDTGILIKPLVQVGQAFPDNWPYKNLYIDTIDYHDWMQTKDDLVVLRDQYQLLPDKIPMPQAEDPSMMQTFGSGAQTVVQVQPPPDPWCDKYFPKNYAALFGIPNILPSILTVDELLFDEQKKPIMIKDPNGQKDSLGKIKLVQKTMKHPVSVQGGYAYVDTGVTVQLCYSILPLLPNSILIPGVGMDYGSLVAGYFTPLDPEAMEIVQKYPYQNDQQDGKIWWMMDDSASVIFQALTGNPPIMIKFRVFIKYNIPCGYPKKCGTLSNAEMELNGKCGLQEFLSKPIIIDTQGLGESSPRNGALTQAEQLASKTIDTLKNLTQGASDAINFANQTITKNYDKLDNDQRQGYQKIKNETMMWKSSVKSSVDNAWNISKQLMTNDLNKSTALANFSSIIQSLLPSLTDLIPPECRYIICDAQREAKQDNCIEGFADNCKNAAKSAGLLANKMMNSAKDQMVNVAKGMGNLATVAAQGATNLVKTFNLYQLCARRFNDYLKDANPLGEVSPTSLLNKTGFKVPDKLNIFAQMQNILAQNIVGRFHRHVK